MNLYTTLTLLFLSLSFSFPCHADTANGLVGYWKLDGGTSGSIANNTTVGFEDASGQGNNGTAKNTNGTGMAWASGRSNGAVNFDGTDDYVTMGNPAALKFAITDAFTISIWVRPTASIASGSSSGIVGDHNGVVEGYGLFYLNGYGICVDCYEWCYYDGYNYSCPRSANSAVVVNQWTNVVAVQDGSGLGSGNHVYVDGVASVNSRCGGSGCDATNTLAYTSTTFTLGNRNGTAGTYFIGDIADVRVYNRALTAREVYSLYVGTKVGTGKVGTGRVGH